MNYNNELIDSIKVYVATGRDKRRCFENIYKYVDKDNFRRYARAVYELGFNEGNVRLWDVLVEMGDRAFQM